jgi:predicted dehydrogenase
MIRVGIIGCGRISDLHILGYEDRTDAAVVALCDVSVELATQKAAAWGTPDATIYGDYRELCSSGDVDLVEIIVPHHLHHEVTVYALAQGLNVSVQKPMAMSLAEADDMIDQSHQASGVMKVYENFIHYPPIARARQIIDAGDIGDPLTIRIKSNSGDPACGWSVPAAAAAWRHDMSKSGGGPLTFDDGHHKVAVAWYLMGSIERVHAWIGSTEIGPGQTMDAPAAITFGFSGGRLGIWDVVYSPNLQIHTDHYTQDDQIEVTGTHGVLWVTRGHGRTLSRAPVIVYRDGVSHEYDDMATGWEASFIASTHNTIDALHGRTPLSLTGEEGREILAADLAIQESAATGVAVTIPKKDAGI